MWSLEGRCRRLILVKLRVRESERLRNGHVAIIWMFVNPTQIVDTFEPIMGFAATYPSHQILIRWDR